jgi:hypothetical protein
MAAQRPLILTSLSKIGIFAKLPFAAQILCPDRNFRAFCVFYDRHVDAKPVLNGHRLD